MTSKADECGHLDAVRDIAVEAGRAILAVYERDFVTSTKEDGSPLTEADRAAHELIVTRLRALTPDVPVLSEESAAIGYKERARWAQFWLVDPLDGTKEFIKRNGEFTVNIALIRDGEPVLGVVHVPVSGATYFACRGEGAFLQVPGRAAQAIHVGFYAGGRARVVASRSHAGDSLRAYLDRLAAAEGEFDTVAMGSSLKLCLVAEGRADVYPRLGPTSEWDTAAAQCVVEVAGGRVTDVHGERLRYNKTSLLNPWFIVSGAGDYDWTAFVEPQSAD
jgi:3'(2'), 5'-bisphosphate nucleotidase